MAFQEVILLTQYSVWLLRQKLQKGNIYAHKEQMKLKQIEVLR